MPRLTPLMNTEAKIGVIAGSDFTATAACYELARLNQSYLDLLDRFDVTGVDLSRLFTNTCDRNVRKLALLLIAADKGLHGLQGATLVRAGSISRPQLDAVYKMDNDIHNPSA